jgi:hypothetical protein
MKTRYQYPAWTGLGIVERFFVITTPAAFWLFLTVTVLRHHLGLPYLWPCLGAGTFLGMLFIYHYQAVVLERQAGELKELRAEVDVLQGDALQDSEQKGEK